MQFKTVSDHNSLSVFYRGNGLEVSQNIEAEDGAIYSIASVKHGRIVAASTLSYRKGVYILDYIAVDETLRRMGAGKTAVGIIAEKARELGADKIYISARNPAFFSSIGFINGSPKGIDMNADCAGCPQFGHGCEPVPMMLII